MSEQQEELTDFTADRDLVDSLKVDISILTPDQDRVFKKRIKVANQKFLEMYGHLIPEETVQKVEGIEDRFLVTETDAYRVMHTEWDSVSTDLTPPSKGAKATFVTQGRIVTISDPRTLWEDIFSEDVRTRIIDVYDGDEQKARDMATQIAFYQFAFHELVHQYQDNELPEEFLECAVPYYQRELSKALETGYILDEQTDTRVEYYEKLVERYGDSVHSLFFTGKAKDIADRLVILGQTAIQKERLFPNGAGLVERKNEDE